MQAVRQTDTETDRLVTIKMLSIDLADGDVHGGHLYVDDHGEQRKTDEHVGRRRHEELGMIGHDVAEPNGAQRDDGEVERLEVRPLFPGHVDQGAEHRVRQTDDDSDRRRQVEFVVHLKPDAHYPYTARIYG